MRIAVTYENGEIFQHFGHTGAFKIYDAENGKITVANVVSTNGSGHGALAGMLKVLEVDVLICGGIGGGASGDADKAVEAFLANELSYNPEVKCDHHDHEHGEGHTCGEHGCGSHNCGGHSCH